MKITLTLSLLLCLPFMASADNELRRALQDQAVHAEVGHHTLATFGEGISNNSDRSLPLPVPIPMVGVNGRDLRKNPVISESDATGKSGKSSSSESEDEAPAKIQDSEQVARVPVAVPGV